MMLTIGHLPSRPSSNPALAAVIARHSRSFSLAARLLPPAVRADAIVLYAWCRHADDLVDEAPRGTATEALAGLRAATADLFADPTAACAAAEPLRAAFAALVIRRGLPAAYVDELLAGMEMDLLHDRYPTVATLLPYCHRVAGVVGLMMCHVLGIKDPRALRHAAHLGIAMQLTNIARDVAEDWARGRLYLPLELLGTAASPLARALDHRAALAAEWRSQLALATHGILDLADRYYASGVRGLPALSPRCALAIRAAQRLYQAIGTVLRRRACDPLTGRAVVPTHDKVVLIGAALCDSLLALPHSWNQARRASVPRCLLPLQQALTLERPR
jgi:phytoene synthase